MTLLVSPLFHPTTSVLIDDSETFLKQLHLQLEDDAICRKFNDPQKALAYCIENSKKMPIADNYLMADTESPDPYEQNFTLRTADLKKALAKAKRFDIISVIVVDFSMPQLTGTEFIDQLRNQVNNKFAKIIMLTGEANHDLAVKLFNKKKIDQFFLKSEVDLMLKVNVAINEMQKAYFLDICESLFSAVFEKTAPILNDAAFATVFEKVKEKLNIVEHYLCENTGSFILADKQGQLTVLVVRTQEELAMYANLAEDQKAPAELVERILNGTMLPFFGTFEKFIASEKDDWIVHSHFGKKIPGKEGYYYSVIESKKLPELPGSENIASFGDYLETEA